MDFVIDFPKWAEIRARRLSTKKKPKLIFDSELYEFFVCVSRWEHSTGKNTQ